MMKIRMNVAAAGIVVVGSLLLASCNEPSEDAAVTNEAAEAAAEATEAAAESAQAVPDPGSPECPDCPANDAAAAEAE